MKMLSLVLLIAVAAVGCASQTTTPSQSNETSQSGGTSALEQVQAIELPNVAGRIDHLALDPEGSRLFVAALGNNTLEVVDLKAGKVTDEIKGLKEPQGVVYVPEDNKLLVTNGDGDSLDIYDVQSLNLLNQVVLGEDTDNVRYDATIGYASSATVLAMSRPLGSSMLVQAPKSRTLSSAATRNHSNWRMVGRRFLSMFQQPVTSRLLTVTKPTWVRRGR